MEEHNIIIGVSCRLPKSRNIEEFWENLIGGHDLIGQLRYPNNLLHVPTRGGVIPDVDRFDADYFRYTEAEANNCSVLQRVLLEVVSECLTDSGCHRDDIRLKKTGLYLATFLQDHDQLDLCRGSGCKEMATSPYIAGNIMKTFGLKGPCINVDTACSSSLSALAMANTDLDLGKCDLAIVAGANIILSPVSSYHMLSLGMLSEGGNSRVLDAEAEGYVRSEGVVAFLLTRPKCGLDIKRIYSSILKIDTNCDGFTNEGITFPNKNIQCQLLSKVYEDDELKKTLAYMELHSTGTKAGDPVETAAVSEVICKVRGQPLLVGSVKANMGHAEATAGLAGMVKCLLIAAHRVIPPQINYRTPNPHIDAVQDGSLHVVTCPTPLPDGVIGVNSFGFGGANGHVLLKPYYRDVKLQTGPKMFILPLKARSSEEFQSYAEFISQSNILCNPHALSYIAQSDLSSDQNRPIRGYFITEEEKDGMYKLEGSELCVDQGRLPICIQLEDIVFGELSVHRNLLDNIAFRNSIQNSQKILTDHLGVDLCLEAVVKGEKNPSTATREGILVAMTTMMAILDVFGACGVPLNNIYFSGLSALVAAQLDGCLTREQCLSLANIIGRIIETTDCKNYTFYKVHLRQRLVYQLGPKVRVLFSVDIDNHIIMVTGYKDKILSNVHAKGGYFSQLSPSAIYTSLLDVGSIQHEVTKVIPYPKYSTSKMCGLDCQRLVDAQFVLDLVSKPMFTCPPLAEDQCVMKVTVMQEETTPSTLNNSSQYRDTVCYADHKSVLHGIGKSYLNGHMVSVKPLFYPSFPLDVRVPSLSSAIYWNHEAEFYVPAWNEFLRKLKDVQESTYVIQDVDRISNPLSLVLYHVWKAVCLSVQGSVEQPESKVIEISKLALPVDLETAMLLGASIQVLKHRKTFTVADRETGELLVSGAFGVYPNLDLPRIPGYDLDINQNYESQPNAEDLLQKTEILWEDNWPDFINTALEFSTQYFDTPLYRMVICPQGHLAEVKDCANILAVAEPFTGLCKAGKGFLLEYLVTSHCSRDDIAGGPIAIENSENLLISEIYVYKVQGQGQCMDRLVLYQGHYKDKVESSLIGLVFLGEESSIAREFPVYQKWSRSEVESIVPYLLARHILLDVGSVTEGQRVVLFPPIDTVGMFVMAIADQMGCVIYTCSYDPEVRQMMNNVLPSVRVLPGDSFVTNMKILTGRDGCDICIKLTSGGVNEAIELLSSSNKYINGPKRYNIKTLVQCAPLLPTESVDLNELFSDGSKLLAIPEMSQAFRTFMQMSDPDWETVLYNIRSEDILKLRLEGFPESKGLLYSLQEVGVFTKVLGMDLILSLLNQDLENSFHDNDLLDDKDKEVLMKLQETLFIPPKDFSIVDMSDRAEEGYVDLNVANMKCSLLSDMDPNDSHWLPSMESQPMKSDSIFVLSLPIVDEDSVDFREKSLQHGKMMHKKGSKPHVGGRLCPFNLSKVITQAKGGIFLNTSPLGQDLKPKQTSTPLAPIGSLHPQETESMNCAHNEEQGSFLAERSEVKQSDPVPQIVISAEPEKSEKESKEKSSKLEEDKNEAVFSPSQRPLMQSHNKEFGQKTLSSRPKLSPLHLSTISNLIRRPSISPQHLQKRKVVTIDLLFHGPPRTPRTPAVRGLLMPSQREPTVVKMNNVNGGKRVYLIHPITGKLVLLQQLAKNLPFPSYGLQRTEATPRDALHSVARYYLNAIQMQDNKEPYTIIGYSFGTCVAIEMALQLQETGKQVCDLILLNGAPGMIQSMFPDMEELREEGYPKEEIACNMESGALIHFLSIYGATDNAALLYKTLSSLPNLTARIETAVDMSLGNVIVSESPRQTKWMLAKEKIMQKKHMERSPRLKMVDAAQEVLRLKRIAYAEDHLKCIKMVSYYKPKPDRKFHGNIHLLRIKADPQQKFRELPVDYGLSKWCTGKIDIRFYDSGHFTLLQGEKGLKVAQDVISILESFGGDL